MTADEKREMSLLLEEDKRNKRKLQATIAKERTEVADKVCE